MCSSCLSLTHHRNILQLFIRSVVEGQMLCCQFWLLKVKFLRTLVWESNAGSWDLSYCLTISPSLLLWPLIIGVLSKKCLHNTKLPSKSLIIFSFTISPKICCECTFWICCGVCIPVTLCANGYQLFQHNLLQKVPVHYWIAFGSLSSIGSLFMCGSFLNSLLFVCWFVL